MNLNSKASYPSGRSPVLAENVVATSQPLAAQAGLSILQRGGNAVARTPFAFSGTENICMGLMPRAAPRQLGHLTAFPKEWFSTDGTA